MSLLEDNSWLDKLTSTEYVFIGGQLLAPQTNAKCIRGSCVSRATLNLGSDLENGLVNIPATCQKIKMQIFCTY
jgi:hypothetical protein